MKKIIFMAAMMIFVLVGCGSKTETVVAGGSNSIQPLFEYYIEEYEAEYPGKKATYDGPGSSKGIEGIKNDTYQLGFASRDLKDSEKDDKMTVTTIAIDGIAVVLSNDNPIKELTTEQIRDIYTGKITNWKEVGGNDATISVVSRDSASGTREAFDSIIGFGKDKDPMIQSAIEFDSNGAIAEAVSKNVDAIGYISFETLSENKDKLNAIKVNGVEPKIENVQDSSYKVARPFNMIYYKEKLTDSSNEMLEWILKNKDTMAEKKGYIPAK